MPLSHTPSAQARRQYPLAAQTKLAARLIMSATTATLKKNETMACSVVSRRNSFEFMETSDVCEAAPNDVEKYKKSQ